MDESVLGTFHSFSRILMILSCSYYTLASADEANLAFNVTAIEPGDGCTSGNNRGSVHVSRGSGTFELANSIPYRGHPHVSFYIKGAGAGGDVE